MTQEDGLKFLKELRELPYDTSKDTTGASDLTSLCTKPEIHEIEEGKVTPSLNTFSF